MKKIIVTFLLFAMLLVNLPVFTAFASEERLSGKTLSREYFDQTIALFEEEEEAFSDPQVLTDEDFFGVYDSETQRWTTPSLLDYDGYPGLGQIEEAVKAGDIPLAKEALQNYYAGKFEATELGYAPSSKKEDLNTARMYLENVIADCTISDIITLGSEFEEYEINVTDSIKGVASASGKRAEIQLLSLRKDGNMGLFYSKESDAVPYIVLTINGRVSDPYYPVADTYIQAGNYSNESFGESPVILTEESYSTIMSPVPARVDSYTKRGLLLFEFPDVDVNDKITNATLYMTGKMMPSDNPSAPDSLPAYKDIVVVSGSDLQWTDENYVWDSATTSDYKSYDGEYICELTSTLSIEPLSTGIKVYKSTGEKAYAYHTVRLMTTAIYYILTTPDGIDGEVTLSISQSVADFPPVVSELSRMPYVTPEKFTMIMKYVYLTSQRAVTQWSTSEEGNNFGSADAAGVAVSALAYPEFKIVREPLSDAPLKSSLPGSYTGGWKAVGDYRTLYTAKKFLFPDGSSTEVSFGYTKYILNLYTRIFLTAKKLGLDSSVAISEEVLDCFEQYLLYLTNMSNPRENGGGWQQGDAGDHKTAAISNYGAMVEAINNPIITWLYSGKKEGQEPSYLSYAYDDGGKAVLRSGWDPQALAIHINADAGKNSHGHSDDMGINLHAYGKMLLADPMQPNYDGTNPITAWMYSTRAHNTIEINDTSQEGSGRNTNRDFTYTDPEGNEETIYGAGECEIGSLHPENREFNKMYNFIRAESFGYKDHNKLTDRFVTYRDVLFIEPEYFIVTDYIEPLNFKTLSNKYAQYWHTLPEANISVDEENNNMKTNFESGANIIVAPVEGSIEIEPAIKKGWYSTANNVVDYVSYVKNAADTVTFNTVLYPLKAQDDKTVKTESLTLDVTEAEASAVKITVTDEILGNEKTAHYYNLHDASKKSERAFGDYTTDASLAFVQKAQDKYEKLIIRDGKKVAVNESTDVLLQSESNISDLGIVWNVDKLSLTTSKDDIIYTDMKIYAPLATKVFLNDEEITFKREGKYIIPKESNGENEPPVLPEIPEEDDEEEQVPEHGSTGNDKDNVNNDSDSDSDKDDDKDDDKGSSNKGSGSGGGGGGGSIKFPSIPVGNVATSEPSLPKQNETFKSQISGHWAEKEIQKMVNDNMITGDENGNLNLNNSVTRAEFATLLVRALKLGEKPYDGAFSDVSGNEWYAKSLSSAAYYGIIQGDGKDAKPNDIITREQMAKMLVTACEIKGKTANADEVAYTDFASVSDWAKDFVKKASTLGILNGFEDGSFSPKGNVLREQAFVAIYRLVY